MSFGICGVAAGAGVTHLSIALANYMDSALGLVTAIVDYSPSQDLYKASAGKKRPGKGICCFSGQDLQKLSITEQYQAVVLDFGNDFQTAGKLFPLCERKIILGSLADWKSDRYGSFLAVLEKSGYSLGTFSFLSRNETGQHVRRLEKEYGISILPEPFLQDPYRIEQKDFGFLQKLVQS